jgi:hypothetical protein
MSEIHFENLWESAEQQLQRETASLSVKDLTEQLITQMSAYRAIDESTAPVEAKNKLKENWMGSILLTMTQLSYKDNINTFTALQLAVEKIKILELSTKYQKV